MSKSNLLPHQNLSIVAIGRIPAVADLPDADLAVFLDGNMNNFADENVVDLNYYCERYTYGDFVEDLRQRNEMLEHIARLESALLQQTLRLAKLQPAL